MKRNTTTALLLSISVLASVPAAFTWVELDGSATGAGLGAGQAPNAAIDREDNPWVCSSGVDEPGASFRAWGGNAWGATNPLPRGRTSVIVLNPLGEQRPVFAWSREGQVLSGWVSGEVIESFGVESSYAGGITANSDHSFGAGLAHNGEGQPVVAWMERGVDEVGIHLKRFDGERWVGVDGSSSGCDIGSLIEAEGTESLPYGSVDIEIDTQGRHILAWNEAVPWNELEEEERDDVFSERKAHVRVVRWDGDKWEMLAPGLGLGSQWQAVNSLRSPMISLDSQDRIIIAFTATHIDPYHYPDETAVLVQRFNGQRWEPVGDSVGRYGIVGRDCSVRNSGVVIGSNDFPIVSVDCVAGGEQVDVAQFDGLRWIWAGEAVEPIGELGWLEGSNPRFAVGPSGLPVLVYETGNEEIHLLSAGPGTSVPGSANGDTIIDAVDLVALINHLNGSEPITLARALSNADVNGDGSVNGEDIDALVALILAMP